MAGSLTGETTELLQTLIRNSCVNDGTPGLGRREPQQRPAGDVPGGPGVAVEHFEPRPGRRSMVARIEGSDPDAPDLVPDGPHRRGARLARRLARGPLRRRAHRRRGVGARRHRHAEPHRLPGGGVPPPRPQRLPAPGHADLLRRGRRGGRRRVGREVDDRAPLGRHRLRLRAHRDGRLAPRRGPQGRHLDRREGPRLAPPDGAGHARPRLDAVPGRQRARQGGRGRRAASPPTGRRPASTSCGPPASRSPACPSRCGRASSTPTGCSTRWPRCRRAPPSCSTPAPTPRSRPTWCTAASRPT